MRQLVDAALLMAATLLLLAAAGIVVPAPTRTLLPWSVGAPELSPLILAAATLLLGASMVVRSPRQRRWARVFATVAAALSLTVVLRIASTERLAFERLHAGLDSTAGLEPGMASPWVSMRTLFSPPAQARLVRETHGILVAAPQGQPLTVDVYQPPQGGGRALVQIYGGAWQHGAPGDNAAAARLFAANGFVVFAIDYRHAPRWQWPAQREDVGLGLRWVRENASRFDADAAHIAIVGRSAGAQLALMAAYTGEPGVSAVVSLYGPSDLTRGYRQLPRPDPIGIRATLEMFLGGTPDAMPQRYREASPITYASRPQPPTLQIIGGHDHIVLATFARSLDAALRAAGNRSVLVEIPWADHAFDAVSGGPSAQIATGTILEFLRRAR